MNASEITRNPQPVYLLSSGEPLLVRDWLDAARAALRDAGFEDILNLQVDAGFDWNALLEDGDSLSLFASQKCRIISIPGGKPGVAGAKAIQAICERAADADIYIFVLPGLDRQSKNSAWCKAIASAGAIVELPPIYDNQLSDWIAQRARSKGFAIDRQAAQFLAERTEGNLLAADQELEKLSIRFAGQDAVDFDTIESSVAESARFNHFLLVDACLAGKSARALRILKSLRAEGYVTTQLRWAVQSALENLDRLQQAQRRGSIGDRLWQEMRIWRGKQRLYQHALGRLRPTQIERLLQSCAKLDRLGKGQQDSAFPEPDWPEIESLVARFSGADGIKDELGIT